MKVVENNQKLFNLQNTRLLNFKECFSSLFFVVQKGLLAKAEISSHWSCK